MAPGPFHRHLLVLSSFVVPFNVAAIVAATAAFFILVMAPLQLKIARAQQVNKRSRGSIAER